MRECKCELPGKDLAARVRIGRGVSLDARGEPLQSEHLSQRLAVLRVEDAAHLTHPPHHALHDGRLRP